MKKRMTSTPHDAVFKRFLRHPETATDFLTLYLPEAILQRCDFSTLRLQSASFIDEDLRAPVFRCPLVGADHLRHGVCLRGDRAPELTG